MKNNRFSYQVTLVIWAALIFLLGVMMSCKSLSVRSGILIELCKKNVALLNCNVVLLLPHLNLAAPRDNNPLHTLMHLSFCLFVCLYNEAQTHSLSLSQIRPDIAIYNCL